MTHPARTHSEDSYRLFVESMRDGAATLSSAGRIVYANRRLGELLGVAREELVGEPLARFVAGAAPPAAGVLLGPDGRGATLRLELLGPDGARVPVQVGTAPLQVDGEPLICLTFTDLSALRAHDREIERLGRTKDRRMADLQQAQVALTVQATHDALTGLPNRALFVDRVAQALHRAARTGRCVAVLFVDLDAFKQINDTQGHAAGDRALRLAAERLVACVRPMDTVARLGGDEFAVLAADIGSRLDAMDMSLRLLAALGSRPDDAQPRIEASIGISVSADGRGSPEAMLVEADTAMYQAKSRGGGRAEVFDAALGRRLKERALAQRSLQSALDEGRIVVHYQPVVQLATGRIVGYEALARIAEHDGSITPPAEFVAAAERSGLIVALGAKVLDVACRDACAWQPGSLGEPRLTVAVNLSARQVQAGDLTAVVRGHLERTGLDPRCLHLELTETATFALHPDLLAQLDRVRALGVQIGLDDFGTGYASLTHLRRLPVTFVKIDQSFVQGLGIDDEDERIVAAVVDLAANLGLRSIAEGVETAAQLRRLQELGCDEAQGFFFARPAGAGGLTQALRRRVW
jgi:diguanylate cyclase (GGDEF)-like protein/PAS domain S-box-containing protein